MSLLRDQGMWYCQSHSDLSPVIRCAATEFLLGLTSLRMRVSAKARLMKGWDIFYHITEPDWWQVTASTPDIEWFRRITRNGVIPCDRTASKFEDRPPSCHGLWRRAWFYGILRFGAKSKYSVFSVRLPMYFYCFVCIGCLNIARERGVS